MKKPQKVGKKPRPETDDLKKKSRKVVQKKNTNISIRRSQYKPAVIDLGWKESDSLVSLLSNPVVPQKRKGLKELLSKQQTPVSKR